MLLDNRDLDLLRLIALCKDIPADCSPLRCDMFSDMESSALTGAGYIRKSKCGLSCRLTDKGYDLLSACGFAVERDAHPVGNGGTLRRRLEVAKTVLSIYRAGIRVLDEPENGAPFYTPVFKFRRQIKGHLLGSSQLCGIIRFSNQTVVVYFITDNTVLTVGIETAATEKMSALLQSSENRMALFFADDAKLLERFISPFDFRNRRCVWGDDLAIQLSWNLYEPPAAPLEVSIYA